jgi:transcriptional regulatory protein LevR
MADKMTYQQARRIRNKDYSLSKLITQNIRRTDMGAGAAIKEAFKEKFDIKTRTKAKISCKTVISISLEVALNHQ